MRPGVLFILYLGVVLSPLALAVAGARPPRPLWDELASGAGMLAFAIILAEFVMSGRFRAISARIGMDVTMRLHQLLARSALLLALIHPFLYRSPFGDAAPWDATRQFSLSMDIVSLGTGVAAWILLPGFVALSIFRDGIGYRYETWRLMHGLGAIAIAGLALIHALEGGRYSQDPVMAGLWIVLFALAVLTLAVVYLFAPLMQGRRPWTVRSVRRIGLKTWELTLEPEGHGGMAYKAGQFAWLNVGNSPFSLHENPFSISSAPASGPGIRFTIKELGDFTKSLGAVAPGTRAWLDGPYGHLAIAGRDEPGIAFIAGGVGIAPLLGILRQLRLEGDKRPTALIFGNRVQEQILYAEELDSLTREHGTKIAHVLSEPPQGWAGAVGMVDAALIRESLEFPAAREWLYVLCGPPAMMEAVEDMLLGLGVPARQVLSERFKYD